MNDELTKIKKTEKKCDRKFYYKEIKNGRWTNPIKKKLFTGASWFWFSTFGDRKDCETVSEKTADSFLRKEKISAEKEIGCGSFNRFTRLRIGELSPPPKSKRNDLGQF